MIYLKQQNTSLGHPSMNVTLDRLGAFAYIS